jgi:hypothetical protein
MVEEAKVPLELIDRPTPRASERSICLFCERILCSENGPATIQHQPDFTTLLGSAGECPLCSLIYKHFALSAKRDIGKLWLKKLRNSDVGHSSTVMIHIRMVSQIVCFRASCDGGPKMLWTPELCCSSLWTLGKLKYISMLDSQYKHQTCLEHHWIYQLFFLLRRNRSPSNSSNMAQFRWLHVPTPSSHHYLLVDRVYVAASFL